MSFPESTRLRPMIESDVDSVLSLERVCEGAPHWNRAEYLTILGDPGSAALRRFAVVAESGEAVAGFAVVRLLTTPEEVEAELESIVVAQEWHRRGMGASLLDYAKSRARGQGARRLALEVRGSNGAAIGLYSRNGFHELGRRRGYYRDPQEDAVLMQAIL